MHIKHWLWGILFVLGITCLAATKEPQRPPQADPPENFEGTLPERLAKYEQFVASIRYKVAVQLACVSKEEDVGASLSKCITFIDECIEETGTNSSNYGRLTALQADVNKEIAEAKKLEASIGDDNESSGAGTKAVALKEEQKLQYEQVKVGYRGVNKLLKEIRTTLLKQSSLWQVAGPKIRPEVSETLMQQYRAWCTWNNKQGAPDVK